MFKQHKLKFAVAVAAGFVAGSSFAAGGLEAGSGAGDDASIFWPASQSTVSAQSSKIWFNYNPAVDGYFIDLIEVPSLTPTGTSACGKTVSTAYVSNGDSSLDCSHTVAPSGADAGEATANALCTWTIPTLLEEDKFYGVNLSEVVLSALIGTDENTTTATTDDNQFHFANAIAARSADNCIGTTGDAGSGSPGDEIYSYQTFKFDTDVAVPTSPPYKVTITSPALHPTTGLAQSCSNITIAPVGTGISDGTAVAGTDCLITFTHKNSPGATWYKVWIEDKNKVRVGDDSISASGKDVDADGNNDDYGFGWFKLGGGTLDVENAATDAVDSSIACSVNLVTDTRTCTLAIGYALADTEIPASGEDYNIWVQAWNAAGTSAWSDDDPSVENAQGRKFKH